MKWEARLILKGDIVPHTKTILDDGIQAELQILRNLMTDYVQLVFSSDASKRMFSQTSQGSYLQRLYQLSSQIRQIITRLKKISPNGLDKEPLKMYHSSPLFQAFLLLKKLEELPDEGQQ